MLFPVDDLLGEAGAVALAASPNLRNLNELDYCDNGIGPKGAAALASSPNLQNVTVLSFDAERDW